MSLKLPIGIGDFKKVIERGYHFVDKSLLIAEVLETNAIVQLITRPRRFGKTLNMSMLHTFFDVGREDNARFFKGLAIERRPHYAHLGRYPVIFLTFKDIKGNTYEEFLEGFAAAMAEAFRDRDYLFDSLRPFDKDDFLAVVKEQCSETKLKDSLAALMKHLARHHDSSVILLIDEYDSPIHTGYSNGYYKQITGFMRGLLGKALKDHPNLEKAVLTGILRVARESIFSDLNHVDVYTLLSHKFSDKFGFTEAETEALLADAGLADRTDEVRRWYNGYLAGEVTIYNPWSIINYIDKASEGFRPYWVNTSSNALIREQLIHAPADVLNDLQHLLAGGTVETPVQEHTVFEDLNQDAQTLWSFFLFCGYLKATGKTWRVNRDHYRLAIPNEEVSLLFQDIIGHWLRRGIGSSKIDRMLECLISGDIETFGLLFGELVRVVLSYYDTAQQNPERVYDAFTLGLLVHLRDRYEITSNRESGFGRYDLSLRPHNPTERGVVFEFKPAESVDGLDKAVQEGLDQIEARHYGTYLEEAGVTRRLEIAAAFFGKEVRVAGREIDVTRR
ncbi:MAG: AAA family ATPase [Acidobacteriota bacterium]|nr:AAA family ATPase [Acidobacteriota bacterium]